MPPKRKGVAKRAKVVSTALPEDEDRPHGKLKHGKAGVLVVELLEEIFRILSDRYFEQVFCMLNEDFHNGSKRKWGNPLVACSRVNKHWNAVAHKLVYRVVVITKPESTHLFLRTLKSRKALIQNVDSFSLDYRYKDLPSQPEREAVEKQKRAETSKATWEVIKLLKGLYHFGVSTYSLEPTPKGSTKADVVPTNILKGLKSLSISEDALCRKTYAHWVKIAAPTLERLRCPAYTTQDSFASTCPPMPNMRSLCVTNSGSYIWKFLNVVLEAGSTPIEDLSLPHADYTDEDANHHTLYRVLQHVAPTLRRLHLALHCGTNEVPAPLAGALRRATRLHTLSVHTHHAPPDFHIPILDALPRTLHTLALGQSSSREQAVTRDAAWARALDDAQALLDRVAQGALPALHAITLGADRQSAMLLNKKNDPARNSLERRANERREKQLVKDAGKLGIVLDVLDEPLPDHLPWFYVNSK